MTDEQRFTELRQDIKDSLGEVKQAIHDLRAELRTDYVSRAEYEVVVFSLRKDIEDMKKGTRWGFDKLIGVATPTVLAIAAFVGGILTR